MRLVRFVTLFSLLVAASACGDDGPTPAPTPTIAQVSGVWTGNLASQNWATVAVNMTLSQSGSTVTGTWASPSDWTGQISGTVDATSFTGTFTLSAPNALGVGPRCTGSSAVNGPAGGVTIRWTGAGFTGSCTGMPIGLTWSLQR
jgi:hypothetical protein